MRASSTARLCKAARMRYGNRDMADLEANCASRKVHGIG